MRAITLIYKDFDEKIAEYLIREQVGWQISPRVIMELDNEGPFFSTYSQDIISNTILASDAIATFAVTIPSDIGKSLVALGGSQVAAMTISELGILFTKQYKEKNENLMLQYFKNKK